MAHPPISFIPQWNASAFSETFQVRFGSPIIILNLSFVEAFLCSRPLAYAMEPNPLEGRDNPSSIDSGQPVCRFLHVELTAHSELQQEMTDNPLYKTGSLCYFLLFTSRTSHYSEDLCIALAQLFPDPRLLPSSIHNNFFLMTSTSMSCHSLSLEF